MLALFTSLAVLIAIAAVWWVRGRQAEREHHVDPTMDRPTWTGLEAEVDGIRFDRSKERIELWRRTP